MPGDKTGARGAARRGAGAEPPASPGASRIASRAPALVNQLVNYDIWLSREVADSVEGFVLGCSAMERSKPADLQLKWPCTWLAIAVEQRLRQKLSPDERLLASHLAGFVREYLWNEEEAKAMGEEARLGLDDVALIRAFAAIGRDLQKKVDEQLLEGLTTLLSDPALTLGAVYSNRGLFKPSARLIQYGSLFGRQGQPPYLSAGLVSHRGTALAVWIETSSTYKAKDSLHATLSSLLPELNSLAMKRNLKWTRLDRSEDQTWDLEIRLPLEHLLAVEDQPAAAHAFFASALDDLKQCGAIAAIGRAIQSPPGAGSVDG